LIFRYNYKSNDVFYSPNSFFKALTALKNSKWSREHTVSMYSTAYNLWTFAWFAHLELPFRLKGTEKSHTEGLAKLNSNIYSFLFVYKETVFFTIKWKIENELWYSKNISDINCQPTFKNKIHEVILQNNFLF